jgi:hypothetical protein
VAGLALQRRRQQIYVRPVRREPAELPAAAPVVHVTCPCCAAPAPAAPPKTRKKPLE